MYVYIYMYTCVHVNMQTNAATPFRSRVLQPDIVFPLRSRHTRYMHFCTVLHSIGMSPYFQSSPFCIRLRQTSSGNDAGTRARGTHPRSPRYEYIARVHGTPRLYVTSTKGLDSDPSTGARAKRSQIVVSAMLQASESVSVIRHTVPDSLDCPPPVVSRARPETDMTTMYFFQEASTTMCTLRGACDMTHFVDSVWVVFREAHQPPSEWTEKCR